MKENKKCYHRDFKLKVVKLSFENRKLEDLAAEFGITSASLLHWRKNYLVNGEENFSIIGKTSLTEQEKKIYALEIKIRKTDAKFEVLNGAADCLHKGLPTLYQYIAENEKKHSSYFMCLTLGISLDAYKRWKSNHISERKKWKIKLKEEITAIFLESNMRYGSRRIAAELQRSGQQVSPETVLNCMRELNLYASASK
ncbi:MAG: IS3 family transposase [Flavobacterium nitrogenifigens]|uniref:IS3 family transposase n=1 Tax=Flavobacterium nitrogenifigens TaxID=1617283 RepID=UPI00280819A3|nr:IS3 family transposase [Flavobacterium nitrogenifigens]MDQ8014302.1 IS3 family transposase [Flavobacterium nitrogenifigens]